MRILRLSCSLMRLLLLCAMAGSSQWVRAEDAVSAAAEPAVYDSIPLSPDSATAVERAPEEKARVIEEVIVTSTKRAASVREIPVSITAFSGKELREVGANELESILRLSPGVAVAPGLDPEAASIIIRGVATDTFFTFFTRTFGLFYEDVSLVNPSILGPQPNLDPFDMKTVEVLKGPQGTLFGGSALAGAVRYVPNRPDYAAAYGEVSAGIGTLARSEELSHRYDGMWNQPMGEDVAIRLVGSRTEHPGYIRDVRADRDDINSSDSTQLRGLASWRIDEDVELRFSALRRKTHQDDGAFANSDDRPEHTQRYYPDRLSSTTDNLLLTLDWGLESNRLVVVLSQLEKQYPQLIDYSAFLGTSLVGIGAFGDTRVRSSQPSAEVRLVSSRPTESSWPIFDGWNYVSGYFFVYSDQFLSLDLGTQPTGGALRLSGDVDAKENAVFFDLTRPLSERWEFGVGGRLFRQTTKAKIDTLVIAGETLLNNPLLGLLQPIVDQLPAAEVPLGRASGEVGETVFNPKFTLQWRYSPEFSMFASAVKGFRYAGANQNPTQDPTVPLFFKSDSIWNYELGARSSWLGGRLQLDGTVFYLKWDDLQVQQRDYTGAFAYTTNVGGARNRGAELAIKAILPAGFAFNLNATYTDARTTTFFDDFQGPAPSGTELPGTSPFTASALLLYGRRLGSTELTSTLSYTYQNRNYNNLPHLYRHPPLGLLGASVGLALPKWPLRPEISLIGNNLTNEFKPGSVFQTPNSGGILTLFNPPRSITLGVTAHFGE